ncbi:prohibitin [Acrasis kona]|uniref:Prohibitin n=1 Tax=Acrasis kona TaxID=1008807 RepID=A0AAW2YRE3_9EUKA
MNQQKIKEQFDLILKSINKNSGGGSGGNNFKYRAPVGVAIALGLGAYALTQSIYHVQGGERAIKFNRFTGVGDRYYEEGVHVLIPLIERPIIYDIKTRPTTITTPTGSRDLQTVNVNVRILHKPDERDLPTMYRRLGLDYAEKVLPSIANEVLKSVVAQYTAAELMSTKRTEVSETIAERLTTRGKQFGIIIENVAVINLVFGAEYSQAVESKQVAAQEAERAKFLVDRAFQDKKSAVLRAEGEAAAVRMLGDALKGKSGFLELRRIEASKEISEVVAKSGNKVYLNSDSLLLNLTEPLKKE